MTERKDILTIYVKSELIDKNDKEDYEKRGYDVNRCFLLPFKLMDRFKLLVQVLKDMTDLTNCGKVFGICDHLDFEIKRLIQSLVYLSNSTSFEKGNKYYKFDRMEIDRKLGRIKEGRVNEQHNKINSKGIEKSTCQWL